MALGMPLTRVRRNVLVDALEVQDPARHAELLSLRRDNPQAWRKALRTLARERGVLAAPAVAEVADAPAPPMDPVPKKATKKKAPAP